jgi:hypothetical protein
MKGFPLVVQFTFQPSRIYAQYDLATLVSVSDIDETMTDALASVDKSMYPIVAVRELATITSDYPTENIFYTDGSMIDDVGGFAVNNINYYETGHNWQNHLVPFRLKSLQYSAAYSNMPSWSISDFVG